MNEIHLHFNAFGYPTRPIEVHVKNIGSHEGGQIINLLNNVMNELQTLTAKVNELNTKVVEMQSTIDSEQAQVAALIAQRDAAIATLTEQKAALEEMLANGANPAQLQSLSDSIDGTIAGLNAAKEDIASTVADEETPPAE